MRISNLKYAWVVEQNGNYTASFTTRDEAREYARQMNGTRILKAPVTIDYTAATVTR